MISDGNLSTVAHLDSTQEEADTGLLLRAYDASVNYHDIVIQTPDTDVLILAIAMRVLEAKFYVKTGNQNKLRLIDVEKLGDGIDYNNKAYVSKALLGLHAFTGWDTTSAFHGRGKVKAFRLMLKHDFVSASKSLGQSWEVSQELFEKLQVFIWETFGLETKCLIFFVHVFVYLFLRVFRLDNIVL